MECCQERQQVGVYMCLAGEEELACQVALVCPTLCNPMDCSLPGSSVHGILQARRVGCHALLQGILLT